MIILPDPEQRAEIDRELGLDRTASDRLWTEVSQIVSSIEAHLQLERLRSEGRNRVATINYVKKLSKQLSKIESLLVEGDDNTNSVVRRELGDILGLMTATRVLSASRGCCRASASAVHHPLGPSPLYSSMCRSVAG